ncbi:MAG: phosphate ABC transporter permease PstA [Hyphomicrobiales bacterium]|nr:phosphate ABC transporter permease PstA [Hyphomicrobiales bacterium]MBV9113649.1 phosphate ABC transporter permease PstA [Hyphomicrobiales bacterium]
MQPAQSRSSSLPARRKSANAIFQGLCYLATALGLTALCLILGSLLYNGIGGLSWRVFTEITPGPGSEGGLLNAIVGSLIMTVLGVAIGTPIGILAGTFMAEYGRYERITPVVRFINDILLSAPSIIIGLFVYELVVVPMGGFSALAGGAALAVIVIPVVVRTTEDMLLLVPSQLREAAASIGAPRSVIIRSVCYKAAQAGIVTGILLAIARVSGETAPLLFTALGNLNFSLSLTSPMASLPLTINQFASSAYPEWQSLAWTGALIITAAVLLLSITARLLVSKRSGP